MKLGITLSVPSTKRSLHTLEFINLCIVNLCKKGNLNRYISPVVFLKFIFRFSIAYPVNG